MQERHSAPRLTCDPKVGLSYCRNVSERGSVRAGEEARKEPKDARHLKTSPSEGFCTRMSHTLILSRHVVGTNDRDRTMTAKLEVLAAAPPLMKNWMSNLAGHNG